MPHVSLCGQTQCVTSLLSHLPDNGTKLHTEMSLLKCMWQPFVAQLAHFPLLLKTHGSPPCSTFIFPHAGWGVYSSSPPCHCLFCWVWTSNSRLSADDIWLRMWHPWLIHTRLMHRNCFCRYFLVWCIHRSMEECTLSCSVLCSIEIDAHVTVFCALLSCTGLSTNYSCACWYRMQPAETLCSPGFTPMKTCLDVQPFAHYVKHIDFSFTNIPPGIEAPREWKVSFQTCNCINIQGCGTECFTSSAFCEAAM